MPVKGYILVNLEPVKTKDALTCLKQLKNPDIKSVDYVTGAFDVVLTVESPDIDKLINLVTEDVRKVDGVQKTETLVCAD